MKLGSLKSKDLDGQLVVVSKDNQKYCDASEIVPSLRLAIENWKQFEAPLARLSEQLEAGQCAKAKAVNQEDFHSPLPRTFQWMDGSAYIQHVILVRKARGAEPPETLRTVPLMYQGSGDNFLAPRQDIPCISTDHGVDFEGEVGVILDNVPMGVTAEQAAQYIRLFVIINDVSLRGLIPAELKQGFGFLQGKPSSAFAPFALTPDELGSAWKDERIHLPLESKLNGQFYGNPDAGAMFFTFGQLIAHAAKTRNLTAGTIIGSGTVSNEDQARGSSCLAEKRMLEMIKYGEIKTPFMKPGDEIQIEMKNAKGENLFGTIKQKVVQVNI